MNSSFNSRLTNRNLRTGNVANYFDQLKQLVQANDGTRSFIYRTVDCHDQSAPFDQDQETRINITHSDHQVSQLTDGFLTFNVTITVKLSQALTGYTDTEHLGKVFIGFRSSNQVLDQLQINCRNMNTGYQQNECCREGFAYSNIKPKCEKKTKRYIHSLYENVSNYSSSVCGVYANLADIADGLAHDYTFEMNLPFDDILALQAFDMYPNAVVGDLELKFYVKPKGLVWCMLDPATVRDYKEVCEGVNISKTITGTSAAQFKHGFTQINGSAMIITSTTITEEEDEPTTIEFVQGASPVSLMCSALKVNSLKSNMYGFGVTEASLQHIYEVFSTPQVIPSQQLDYNAFPLSATASGIQSTINMPINNTSCISIMFPKHSSDYTVFENPIYSNLQLNVNGRNLPDETVNTLGARFLQYQLVAADLDGGLEATKEFEDSIIMAKNNTDDSNALYANSLSDSTAFMLNIQCERGNSGYTFDGYDSEGQNVPIQITGSPIYTGDNDSYMHEFGSSITPPPPQIWLCRDTYFIASADGLHYVRNGTPEL